MAAFTKIPAILQWEEITVSNVGQPACVYGKERAATYRIKTCQLKCLQNKQAETNTPL